MKTKHNFSLVEILLALGVCAIGVCSVMVLFPIGATASRDASMETYAAHCAETMLEYWNYSAASYWNNLNSVPSLSSFDDLALAEDNTKYDDTNYWNLYSASIGKSFFRKYGSNGVFQLVGYYGNGVEYYINDAQIDNRVIVKVRRQPITIVEIDKDGNNHARTISEDIGRRILVEASWPAELPYAERTKRVYSLDIFNRQ